MACTPQEPSGPPAMDAAVDVEDARTDPVDDAGPDAMVTDRGVIDATGTPDASMTAPDADPPDLGPPDTGVMPDVGFNFDSGTGACPTFDLAPATVDFGTLAEGMPRTQFFQIIPEIRAVSSSEMCIGRRYKVISLGGQ